jgi:hypothetical protein
VIVKHETDNSCRKSRGRRHKSMSIVGSAFY